MKIVIIIFVPTNVSLYDNHIHVGDIFYFTAHFHK